MITIAWVIPACSDVARDNPDDPKAGKFSIRLTPNLVSGSAISGHEDIVITFDISMKKDTVTLGGNMGDVVEADNISWSKSVFENDTLTITPNPDEGERSLWPEGEGTLVVNGRCDCEGSTAMDTVTLGYTVENAVFVASADDVTNTGDPENPGTRRAPLSVVQDGIDLADDLYDVGEVRVAVGTYQSDYNSTGEPVADMVEGISLYGGYSSDFLSRDVLNNETVLEDLSNTGGGSGSTAEFNRVVIVNSSSITNATAIDGFTIKGGGGDYACAILCLSGIPIINNNKIYGSTNETGETYGIVNSSSPIIQNNYIHGGSGDADDASVGIYNESTTDNTEIIDNEIDGGTGVTSYGIMNLCIVSSIQRNKITGGGGNDDSYGIWNFNATTDIINNIIYGGSGTATANGIYLLNDSSNILNNTIDGGWCASRSATGEYCIRLAGTGTPVINNNIMLITDGQGTPPPRYGIYEGGSDPFSVKNNNIFSCATALYYDNDDTGNENKTVIGDVNSFAYASGNISTSPVFVNYDWTVSWSSADLRLDSSTDVNVKQGGLDGYANGWGFSNDFTNLITRTNLTDGPDDDPSNTDAAGWSMGAYECD